MRFLSLGLLILAACNAPRIPEHIQQTSGSIQTIQDAALAKIEVVQLKLEMHKIQKSIDSLRVVLAELERDVLILKIQSEMRK